MKLAWRRNCRLVFRREPQDGADAQKHVFLSILGTTFDFKGRILSSDFWKCQSNRRVLVGFLGKAEIWDGIWILRL